MAHVLAHQSLQVQFPMQVKVMTELGTKEYHLKKHYELSLKTIGEMPQLVEPTDEQKEWVLHRLKQSVEYWQRWFLGQYFTQEQKAAMGLTDRYCRKGN
jgi:hypothetical protein